MFLGRAEGAILLALSYIRHLEHLSIRGNHAIRPDRCPTRSLARGLPQASLSVLYCRSCEIESFWKKDTSSFAQLAMSTDDLETMEAV